MSIAKIILSMSLVKGLIPWETVYYSSFLNTSREFTQSILYMHAERENVLLPQLPALANEKK